MLEIRIIQVPGEKEKFIYTVAYQAKNLARGRFEGPTLKDGWSKLVTKLLETEAELKEIGDEQ